MFIFIIRCSSLPDQATLSSDYFKKKLLISVHTSQKNCFELKINLESLVIFHHKSYDRPIEYRLSLYLTNRAIRTKVAYKRTFSNLS